MQEKRENSTGYKKHSFWMCCAVLCCAVAIRWGEGESYVKEGDSYVKAPETPKTPKTSYGRTHYKKKVWQCQQSSHT
jgi:hypothetical protein